METTIENKEISIEKRQILEREGNSNNEIKTNKESENYKTIDNNIEDKQKQNIIVITKDTNLSPSLFSLSNILDYKCFSCGLIPSPECAEEVICCDEILLCGECHKKNFEQIKKECPICKSTEVKYRKIKDENKLLYKYFKNLKIKCPYKCEWNGIWADLDNHLNECQYGFKYCKYKKIGCEFVDYNKTVFEHEKNNDKFHLELALKYIKDNKIEKKNVKFILGEKIKVSCHPHVMTYMTSLNWICDGTDLPSGCLSVNHSFNSTVPRYRCILCDFDLCDKCVVKYAI